MTNIPMKLTRTLRTGINTVVVDTLPNDVPAIVSKNIDDTYTIALNNAFSFERLQLEFLHELIHLEENHFESTSADAAEKLVRGMETTKRPEPFFYFMNEGLAIGHYLKESYRLKKELEERERISAAQAKAEVDRWIQELERKERRTSRRNNERTPEWVKEVRRKVGLTK